VCESENARLKTHNSTQTIEIDRLRRELTQQVIGFLLTLLKEEGVGEILM
jgi:hypothetical protein